MPWQTLILWFVAAVLAGAAGGAVTGVKLGGEAMGREVAALMGGLFGLSAVVPATLITLLVRAFL